MNNQNLGMNRMRQRDFSNPEEAREVLEHLGGEDLLKDKFPKVYAAYLKTVEKHNHEKQLNTHTLSKGESEKNTDGLENGAFAGAISLTPVSGQVKSNVLMANQENKSEEAGMVTGATSVQGNEDWTVAYVSGYMKNETDGTIIHSFGRKLDNINYYETVQQRNSEDLNQFGNQKIKNYIDCSAVLKSDGTMISLNADSQEFILEGDSSPVVYMNIKDPRSYIGNNPILMMYGRSPDKGETADYNYPDNHIISGTDAVRTIFPVKGKITFSDDITPVEYNTEITSQKPQLQFRGKGVCKYNYSQAEIASCFKISETNPQVVEFELKQDWNANLDISAYTGQVHEGDISFLFSFFMKTKIKGTPIEHNQPVSIYSTNTLEKGKTYYESTDDTNAYLPYIFIRWGCFGKDTMIQMADMTVKTVSDLKAGDQLLGENGKVIFIKDMVSGNEEMIFCIQTKDGKRLLVSGMHPILTSKGAVRARDIKPKMKLLCVDGIEDEVEFNYTRFYNDKVYSIVSEGGSEWVAANGIWAGDFDLQNNKGHMPKNETPVSDEIRELSAEFDQLLRHLGVL
ncbi:Hint domain-containing protein [Fusibacter sp. 3D3]|uniref:Hint domain-containing protein n=1 Tax=Fusibacter sp. 3D3 TaxID=1048380 RepID=UPI00085397DB|nr:Hint domain-containing protein [Fusibacter sp. 3D3]GAU76011.1 hypothetical protein F3D3_0607 [Fusibacter sp. 3D3]